MNIILSILFFVIYTLHASVDERDIKRSRNIFVSMRHTWEALKEEAELRKKRKFGLGNSANRDGNKSSARRLVPVKASMLEETVRLSYSPIAYKPEKNVSLIDPLKKIQLMTKVRQHTYIKHQPLQPLYLSASE